MRTDWLAIGGVRGWCVAAVVFGSLLCCGSLQKAPPNFDAAAKEFVPKPGHARIYVYRLGGHWLGRYDSVIEIDSKYIGSISKGLYVFMDVSPGDHVVSGATLVVHHAYVREIARAHWGVTVNTTGGNVYFVRVEVPRGPTDRSLIELVGQSEGMLGVQQCWLAD